jgi:hypothetical protein
MSLSDNFRDWLLLPIMAKLNEIEKEIQTMATTQAQFDAILTQLGDVVTAEDSTINTALTAISALLAKIVAGSTADLTSEATAAQSMIADIQTQTATLASAVATASK